MPSSSEAKHEKRYITDPAERDRVLTCAFCGEAYPDGTPTYKLAALTAHIRKCPAHPIGAENRTLLAALKKAEVELSFSFDRDGRVGTHEARDVVRAAIAKAQEQK